MEMSVEEKYWEFILNFYPEHYISKDAMISNWEKGFAFDHFAESLNMTEDELLEKI